MSLPKRPLAKQFDEVAGCGPKGKTKFGKNFDPGYEDLDLFQVGGVIFF